MSVNPAFAKPIARVRLHEEIVTIIQKQIINGTIMPGTKLPPERELAETFNVNRTTLREALRKLENLELLEIRHGDGVYAKNFLESSNMDLIKAASVTGEINQTILNLLEVRRIVVPEMASLAAQRRTATDLIEFEQVTFHQELTMLERDIKVHQLIARYTHNLVYTIMLNFFNQFIREYGYLYFDNENNIQRTRKFHRELFEAIKSQDASEARSVMLNAMIKAEEAVHESLAGKQ
jgi:GntR family transcriptional repressor for pyruvate dehydrogenase complex